MRQIKLSALILLLAGASGLLAKGEESAANATPQATAASRQAPAATFAAEIEQVIVDVVVTDRKGNPVASLTRDEMTVTEDGVPQEIVSFEAIEFPDEPAPLAPPPPRVSTNTDPGSKRGRTFVIVFDDLNMTPQRALGSKAAVASFLESGVREGDYVTLIATSGGVWWTSRMTAGREKLLDAVTHLEGRHMRDISNDRMTDWEAMRIHVDRDPQVVARVMRRFKAYGVVMAGESDPTSPLIGTTEDPFVAARAADVYYQATTRNRLALEILERALNGLATARGRKSVILVSEGFIFDPSLQGFKQVQEASRRANAAIYFVNARGLEGMPLELTAQFGPALAAQDVGHTIVGERLEAAAGSESLAENSGGFTVRNTNDLASGIQRIAKETRAYYLLGYRPTSTARDGKFRKIEVKLRDGKGLDVRARKGYFAPAADGQPAPATRPGVDPVFQVALDSPWAADGIPLRMTAYVGPERMLGKAEVLLVAEIDIRGLRFEEVEGRHLSEVEFVLAVIQRETGEFFNYNQTVNLKLRPSTREMLNRVWFPIIRDFELQPGDHQARLVVKEAATGVVGSVVHEFDVLPLEEFRVSTPVLSDTLRKSGTGERPQPQLLARREFPQGATLLCQFGVFGAARGDDGMPRVMQGYEVRQADGTLYAAQPESEMTPTSLGHLSRMLGLPLQGAAPGDYEMRLTVRDEITGKSLELREPFAVVPPYPSSTDADADSDPPVE